MLHVCYTLDFGSNLAIYHIFSMLLVDGYIKHATNSQSSLDLWLPCKWLWILMNLLLTQVECYLLEPFQLYGVIWISNQLGISSSNLWNGLGNYVASFTFIEIDHLQKNALAPISCLLGWGQKSHHVPSSWQTKSQVAKLICVCVCLFLFQQLESDHVQKDVLTLYTSLEGKTPLSHTKV